MNAEALQQIETSYRDAHALAEEAREQRNRAIRLAIAAGWTHAEIADATGLTRTRIGQIALSN